MSNIKFIGILGGTFDPIHNAHLAIAQYAHEQLQLDRVKFIPCALTPHRDQPQRSAEQRCDMVKLAIEGRQDFELDDRECQREGHSYTIDTLRSLKSEFGDTAILFLIMGTDAFDKIESWKDYTKLTDYSHIVVIERPGYSVTGESLKHFVEQHHCESSSLKAKPGGCITLLEGPALDISATRIRRYFDLDMPDTGQAISSLSQEIPESVKHYIHQHGLYQERQY